MEKRRHPRLKEYNYAEAGAYFVTVCVQSRRHILSRIVVGRDAHIPPLVELSPVGRILDKYILNINTVYENVSVEKYVIMPNHFHLLLLIGAPGDSGMRASRPTVPSIIRSLKTMVTRESGQSLFQSSFHDHIIRDENGFLTRWNYIDENPAKWADDEYYAAP